MKYIRLLFLPLSLVYGLIVWLRNRFYDWGWLKSTSLEIHTIVVGNLAVGGTGKSPMTEYLIRLLEGRYKLATLSRGYGRKTRGFLEVGQDTTADESGDEPLQFKHKFPKLTVAVCEDRVAGVKQLLAQKHEVVLLDDAFQHRALTPGLSLLLFEYGSLRRYNLLLPAGNYRDFFSERKRADVLVVTKTPADASQQDKYRIRRLLDVASDKPILFAGIGYGPLVPLMPDGGGSLPALNKNTAVLLVTGIVNPAPLHDHLFAQVNHVAHMAFADHHRYTVADMHRIKNRFDQISNLDKCIITTEKDAQRFLNPALSGQVSELPMGYIPIHMQFDQDDVTTLQGLVLDYCDQSY